MVKIYTLSHPITNEIRYIGKTKFSLEKRLKYGHLRDLNKYNNKRVNWIKSLKSLGLEPKIELLEEVSKDQWINSEIYWISQFKAWGFRLVNMTDGGDGNNNQVFSKKTILLRSLKTKGQKRTDEQKKNISDSLIGKPKSEIHKTNVRKSIIELQGKSVLKYSLAGIFLEEYDSVRAACADTGADRGNLIKACKSSIKKVVKGFKWKYKN